MARAVTLGVLLLCCMAALRPTAAEDETLLQPGVRGWRGDWTARYPDADPVTAWDIKRGINVLWRVPFKQFSNAMPVIVGEKVFTCAEPRTLICLDKMTGKLLWANTPASAEPLTKPEQLDELVAHAAPGAAPPDAPVPWSQRKLNYGQFSGSSIPTPVTDGAHIWIKNGATAACFDLDGHRKWVADTHLMATDHPMNVPSPVLAGKALVCEGGITDYWKQNSKNKVADGTFPANPNPKFKHWMVGLNAETGALLWDIGPLSAGGYGGPASPMALVVSDGTERQTLILTSEGALIRPEDGKLLLPFVGARAGTASPCPLGKGAVYTAHGKQALVEFLMKSRDQVEAKAAWAEGSMPAAGGSVYHDGLIYLCGVAGRAAKVNVHDARTGALVCQAPLPMRLPAEANDWASPACAGKYVFLLTSRTAAVLEPGRKPRCLAVNEFERCYSGPVFDGERMYLRTFDALYCFARKGPEGARYENEVQARTLLAGFPARLERRTLRAIAPAKDFKPARGTPVVPLELGKLPEQWLFAGPLPVSPDKDALESLGGCAQARPGQGAAVTFAGGTATFVRLDKRHVSGEGLNADGPVGGKRGGQGFYFTVLQVAQPTTVAYQLDSPFAQTWLAGEPLQGGEYVQLGQGAYPLLLKVVVPADHPQCEEVLLRASFRAAKPPEEEHQDMLSAIREGKEVLKRIMKLAPGSQEAARATELLKRAEAQ